MNIVIADDEKMARKSLSMFISREFPGLTIVGEASDGIELKAMLENYAPDIAIIDVRMLGLSGLEVMQLAKSRGSRTHFIVNTAYSDFEYVKAALDLKADGYMLKPMKRQDMVESVARIIALVEQEQQQQQQREELDHILETVEPTLASQIVQSICAGDCDRSAFDTYCRMKSLTFAAGAIFEYVPVSGRIGIGQRALQTAIDERLGGIADYLLSSSRDAVIILLITQEQMPDDRRAAWFREMQGLFYEEICRILDQNVVMGMGSIVEEFGKMNQSYYSCSESIHSQLSNRTAEIAPENRAAGYTEMTKAYFRHHYSEDISLPDCAAQLGISPYYLSHTFKAGTGMTCLEYLTQLRMERAQELCCDTSVPLKDIGQMCGYNNNSYFYKVFKVYTGTTIGKYRKDHQNVITESADA